MGNSTLATSQLPVTLPTNSITAPSNEFYRDLFYSYTASCTGVLMLTREKTDSLARFAIYSNCSSTADLISKSYLTGPFVSSVVEKVNIGDNLIIRAGSDDLFQFTGWNFTISCQAESVHVLPPGPPSIHPSPSNATLPAP